MNAWLTKRIPSPPSRDCMARIAFWVPARLGGTEVKSQRIDQSGLIFLHGLIDGSSRVNDGAQGRNGARHIFTLPNIAPEDDTLGAAQHGAVDDLQGGALGIHLGPAGDKCWHRTVSGDFPKSFGSAGVIGFNDVCSMLKSNPSS